MENIRKNIWVFGRRKKESKPTGLEFVIHID